MAVERNIDYAFLFALDDMFPAVTARFPVRVWERGFSFFNFFNFNLFSTKFTEIFFFKINRKLYILVDSKKEDKNETFINGCKILM